MSEQKQSPFVSLIRKAAGLPTAGSGCCGTTAAAASPASSCCGPAPAKEAEATTPASSCCGSSQNKLAEEPRTVVSKSSCC